MLELLVFETDPIRASALKAAGYTSFIVDLETLGKDLRQLGYGTEINHNSADDIRRLRDAGIARIWTRLNRFGAHTPGEIDLAIANGTTVIILPMVCSTAEVAAALAHIGGRAELCVMIETPEAVAIAGELGRLPISAAYFGLNDYAISSGQRNIFLAVADGTVARVRQALGATPFGFAGLTHPELGAPIPSMRILQELERSACSFTFLRRSFRRDLARFTPAEIRAAIARAWEAAQRRGHAQRVADHAAFVAQVNAMAAQPLI